MQNLKRLLGITMNRKFLDRSRIVGLLLIASAALPACTAHPHGACLNYEPQQSMRTVTLRGYGYIDILQETMVCTQRSDVLIAGTGLD